MEGKAKSKVRQRGQIIDKGNDVYLIKIFQGRDAMGKRRYISKQIKGSKAANRWLTAALRDKDLGVLVEPASITLNEYLNRWLISAARTRVSERTADGYAGLLERYIRGPLGHRRLDKVQPLDIQGVYGEMLARGLSARVVRHAHSALHNALKQAVKWGLLIRNPSDLVELPKVPHKERRVLSPDEAVSFLKVASEMPHGLLFEFALLTGMRPEEYLAIKWADIDFERNTAAVRRALVRHNKKWSFQEPKTPRSRRVSG